MSMFQLFYVALVLLGFTIHASWPMKAIAATGSPNVIVIFVDDQGYYDLGCYGASEVKTPRIDAMANEGVLFEDYYAAAPICSPSRAGLVNGLLSTSCGQPHLGAPR